VSCHLSWGQSRKWGVWNAYNRQPLLLQAGDSTTDWTYNTATWRPSNDDSDNSLTVFTGLAEEKFDCRFFQVMGVVSTSSAEQQNGIGWNSTSAASGSFGRLGTTNNSVTSLGEGNASLLQAPALGANVVTALERMADTATTGGNWFATQDNMVLSARWRG
jgi:hypothetical protein